MTEEKNTRPELDKRLEGVAWGLVLILVGVVWIIPFPSWLVLEETWFIGIGLIMLGLNAARYFSNLAISGFTVVMGTLALLLGLAAVGGVRLPAIPIILVVIGLYLLVRIVALGAGRTNESRF